MPPILSKGKAMRFERLLWPAATFSSAVILGAAIVTHGIMVRPARYTFSFRDSPYQVWRGDTTTGEAIHAYPIEGVWKEHEYFPTRKSNSN